MQFNDTRPVQKQGVRPAVRATLLIVTGLIVLGAVACSWLADRAARTTEPPSSMTDGPPAVRGNVSPTPVAPPPPAVAAGDGNVPSPIAEREGWIRTLRDGAQATEARIQAARRLAESADPAALAALQEVIRDGPDELCVAIAEALGQCPHPASASILLGLLADPREAVVCAAVRGLARQDSIPALGELSRLLDDATQALSVRCEAAAGLAGMKQPGAMEALGRAAMQIGDEAIQSQLLDSVANRPLDECREFFQNYLQAPHLSPDLKVTALEALGHTPGEVGAILVDYLGNPDSELRAAAAWALSTADEPGALAAQLMSALLSESDPAVRRRLYQALANQEQVDWQSVLPVVQREGDVIARLAGLDLLASLLGNDLLRNSPFDQQLAYFDQTVVPELQNAALVGRSSDLRQQAIIALGRAGTPAALEALQDVYRRVDNAPVPAGPHPGE